jgi:hypothetical protein
MRPRMIHPPSHPVACAKLAASTRSPRHPRPIPPISRASATATSPNRLQNRLEQTDSKHLTENWLRSSKKESRRQQPGPPPGHRRFIGVHLRSSAAIMVFPQAANAAQAARIPASAPTSSTRSPRHPRPIPPTSRASATATSPSRLQNRLEQTDSKHLIENWLRLSKKEFRPQQPGPPPGHRRFIGVHLRSSAANMVFREAANAPQAARIPASAPTSSTRSPRHPRPIPPTSRASATATSPSRLQNLLEQTDSKHLIENWLRSSKK